MNSELDISTNITNNLTSEVELEYVTSKKILQAWKNNSFFQANCEGRRGIGKSSFAIKVFFDIFRYLKYDTNTAWDMALDRVKYTIPEIIEYIDTASDREYGKLGLIWDDASVFGSSYRFFSHQKEAVMLQAMMDTVRSSINSMILTMPNQQQLLRFLRRYDAYVLQIGYSDTGGNDRVCRGYIWYTLPSGKRLIYPKYRDTFYVRLPDPVYKRYMQKRESYNRDNIISLREILNRVKEKKEVKNDG